MKVKFLEVRDRATYIPAIAIQMLADTESQLHYLSEAGYPQDGSSIMLMVVYNGKATNDPYEWSRLGYGTRTMTVAHEFILEKFDELNEGDVIDVEYILGEKARKKIAQRLEAVK